jgi:hypothetical protein
MRTSGPEPESTRTRVVRAIAERESVDPIRLDPPLNEVVDPDALDAMFAGPTACGVVRFSYRDLVVQVAADGRVRVERGHEGTSLLAADGAAGERSTPMDG